MQGKVLVAQGGGPTAVINQSLAGVVLESRKFRHVGLVYGALHGVRGILDEDFVDLTQETTNNLELVGETPSSALGSTRDKPVCDQIKEKLGIDRVRGDTFGYLQRSFVGCVSDVDKREAREVGEKAVQYAMWGEADGSVAIERTGYYSVDYRLVSLEAVAGKTRTVPDEFISTSGTDVTDAFRLYLRPLLGKSMPDAYRLRQNRVAKSLK
jgi:6-phosphofructokinase